MADIKQKNSDKNTSYAGKTCHNQRISEDCELGLVSVIIPTYNRAKFLVEAMDSVLAQTYRPIELIVVDDGSTDDTKKFVDKWSKKYADDARFELRYFYQENYGSQIARNHGLRVARGKYIRFLDSDDRLLPNATQPQVDMLEKTGANVCYGDWLETCADELRGEERVGAFSTGPSMPDPVEALLGDKWCPSFCYLVRKTIATGVGGWDEEYKALQDRDFILRIAYTGCSFVHVPCTVGCYYQHSNTRVSRGSNQLWNEFMKKVIYDGIAWLNANSEWTEARREAVANSLFLHARRFHGSDRSQFRECIQTLREISPHFRPPGSVYPLVVWALGYEWAETVRRFCRWLLRRI